ncbi:unnamed protein product, partial [Polarella glacialis]
ERSLWSSRGQEVEERCKVLQGRLQAESEKVRTLEGSCEALRLQKAACQKMQSRLNWWEASVDSIAALCAESEIVAWEKELREATQQTLGRLADRRLELRVAAAM